MADELDFVDIGPIGTEEPETTLLEERRQALDALNDIMGSSEQCPRKEKRGAQHAPLSAAADAFGTSEQSFNNELSQLLFQDIHSTYTDGNRDQHFGPDAVGSPSRHNGSTFDPDAITLTGELKNEMISVSSLYLAAKLKRRSF